MVEFWDFGRPHAQTGYADQFGLVSEEPDLRFPGLFVRYWVRSDRIVLSENCRTDALDLPKRTGRAVRTEQKPGNRRGDRSLVA